MNDGRLAEFDLTDVQHGPRQADWTLCGQFQLGRGPIEHAVAVTAGLPRAAAQEAAETSVAPVPRHTDRMVKVNSAPQLSAFRDSCSTSSTYLRDSHVRRSAGHMDYFNAVSPYLIEDQPVLEAFHRPAAAASQCQLSETAENAHFWHAGQGVKATDVLVKKALGCFQSRLFLEIIRGAGELNAVSPPDLALVCKRPENENGPQRQTLESTEQS
jgi:hypothetical protein